MDSYLANPQQIGFSMNIEFIRAHDLSYFMRYEHTVIYRGFVNDCMLISHEILKIQSSYELNIQHEYDLLRVRSA